MPKRRKPLIIYLGVAVCVVAIPVIWFVSSRRPGNGGHSPAHPVATNHVKASNTAKDTAVQSPKQNKPTVPSLYKAPPVVAAVQPLPLVSAQVAATPLLFGMGPQADSAENQRLTSEAPVKILSSWYNNPNDLGFMRDWQRSRIPNAYAKGYALHLIVWTDKPEADIATKYGPACGRSYPFSSSFESDMRELATTFRGSGPLYVSMFTELQTYPCQDNTWKGSENYYRALMDQYRLARDIFKQNAPNSQVSLSWGGWQSRWDDPVSGSGRSLISHFADVMNSSDFQSFQAMDSVDNVSDINQMSALLHTYGNGRVMVAHYKPDNGSQATWNHDLEQLFTPSGVTRLKGNGVFAFNFMDAANVNANEASYQQAKNILLNYGQ